MEQKTVLQLVQEISQMEVRQAQVLDDYRRLLQSDDPNVCLPATVFGLTVNIPLSTVPQQTVVQVVTASQIAMLEEMKTAWESVIRAATGEYNRYVMLLTEAAANAQAQSSAMQQQPASPPPTRPSIMPPKYTTVPIV